MPYKHKKQDTEITLSLTSAFTKADLVTTKSQEKNAYHLVVENKKTGQNCRLDVLNSVVSSDVALSNFGDLSGIEKQPRHVGTEKVARAVIKYLSTPSM